MDWKYRLEKFHDENRYFIPLVMVGLILMITGVFFKGPLVLNYDVLVNRTLLFNSDAVIQAVTLRPGWNFTFNVVANKPVVLSIFNLEGETVAFSDSNSISYSPDFLDLYFVKVSGINYAILDFNYSKIGYEPYPVPFMFFGSGLLLIIGVVLYHALEPWSIKMKRRLSMIDGIFYPLMFLLSSIVFWVFRDSLIWFLPKSFDNLYALIFVSLAFVFVLSIFYIKRLSDFFKSIIGYFIAYFLLVFVTVIDYSFYGFWVLFLQVSLLVVLGFLTFFSRNSTALVVYGLTFFTGLVFRVLAYSVGIPVVFDMFLTVPVTTGLVPLLFVLEFFMALSVYFIIRGYYASNKAGAVSYGFYAGVLVQAFLQVFTGTSLL